MTQMIRRTDLKTTSFIREDLLPPDGDPSHVMKLHKMLLITHGTCISHLVSGVVFDESTRTSVVCHIRSFRI